MEKLALPRNESNGYLTLISTLLLGLGFGWAGAMYQLDSQSRLKAWLDTNAAKKHSEPQYLTMRPQKAEPSVEIHSELAKTTADIEAPRIRLTGAQKVAQLIQEGQLDEARDLLQEACSRQKRGACRKLDELIAANPELALNSIPLTAENQDEYLKQVEQRCDVGHSRACYQLGSVYKMQGDWSAAIQAFDRSCNRGYRDGCDALDRVRQKMQRVLALAETEDADQGKIEVEHFGGQLVGSQYQEQTLNQ